MEYAVKLPDLSSIEPDTADMEGWTVVEGSPTMKTWVLHTSEDGSMISGYWEATPGTYHAVYTEYEFVHMMQGRVTITAEGQAPVVLEPGRCVRHRAGLQGHLEDRRADPQAFCDQAEVSCPIDRRGKPLLNPPHKGEDLMCGNALTTMVIADTGRKVGWGSKGLARLSPPPCGEGLGGVFASR